MQLLKPIALGIILGLLAPRPIQAAIHLDVKMVRAHPVQDSDLVLKKQTAERVLFFRGRPQTFSVGRGLSLEVAVQQIGPEGPGTLFEIDSRLVKKSGQVLGRYRLLASQGEQVRLPGRPGSQLKEARIPDFFFRPSL